jgi:hypothetical protein
MSKSNNHVYWVRRYQFDFHELSSAYLVLGHIFLDFFLEVLDTSVQFGSNRINLTYIKFRKSRGMSLRVELR